MGDRLEELILQGNFNEAKQLYAQTSFKSFSHELLSTAFDNESLANYSFLAMLLLEGEDEKLHDLAYLVLSQPLCHIEGAYASALYHAQRAVELTDFKNVKRLENLLFLNIVPEKVVSDEKAKEIASKILVLDPENEVAQEMLR
ncbi:hypothetical protein B0H99_10317 [Planomicrobium soli]|uniref:Tetratricopeptide repeat protein n=1 Tax=Planomicrobium soli TaxID=1176648 RepID=A0A2P8H3T6_9BACL|nr:hypothetical protein [Planomicrobium soli]PSL40885.1 hypothetical protein B0H99_10317 [Planomicrobium soli]